MDSTKDQKKNAERLARVRENQRKSRARKQEYVNELEQRLAVYKEQAHQKDIEHRLVTQKVEAENRHLRALLGSLGVSSASVQQYLQEADTGANINRKVAIPAIQRIEGENPLSLSRRDVRRSNLLMAVPRVYKEEPETTELRAAVSSACSSTVVQPMDQPEAVRNACASTMVQPTEEREAVRSACAPTVVQPTEEREAVRSACAPTVVQPTEEREAVRSVCAPTAVQTTDQSPKQAPQEEDPALCGCRTDRENPETVSDEDVLNSTLCAIAEEMINQYNTKGIDVDEIRRRIWSGFRAGANGTGCRVQNHILFQVLDDISSDI
ncbi:unnamed protein product [Penicillium nalgiovense]|uniref:BZIP domain-containing protein n=1 Tax=Penicillium nalgiovense TaxID=60175 RepID=A0A9W4HML3_PENNA|nr:unnamed protein product [Penicillium nalgiovense]CAG7982741.1 unnamed protein product [Penicillium nalgiovense]CAG8020790.1 unnamed protein product [Penicillium nalgiovense]CAG8060570.1 unnamed protein product [Penicillium nalgiovense]CAG8075425.1 unnamed protein product [Penicillium nalgiovense]